ncbi:hypothetical protein HPB47_017862 [Ixodes persulcatus]|uniref:Uncharacterized protein n=1 Tax=Ixodes persulcatus TaxID=34615 RepID=A0AC60QM96_IXOPE|nr:hypothetical protein HPB47_017862 [Ixodes persulcatus]
MLDLRNVEVLRGTACKKRLSHLLTVCSHVGYFFQSRERNNIIALRGHGRKKKFSFRVDVFFSTLHQNHATPIIEENAMGNQGTLGPPIVNLAGSISANSEIEEMESAVSLTSGTCGPQTPANATQSPTSDVTTIDIQLDTGLLRHLGISKEDVGRLITELLVHYAQGTLNLRSAIPQDVPNEGTGTQPTPDCKMVYHPPSNDFPALNDPQGKENASLEVSQATLTSEGNGFLDHVSQLDNWQTNTIAITTRNEQTTEKLLKITELNKEDKGRLRPYKAMGNNHSRGVIYLNGDDSEETPETLLADLECRTAKVVYERLMGKDSNAVVVTFEGTRLPKKVVFFRQIFNVKPYRPRPIVCYNCHGLGHMTDVCPCHERRCGCCGYIHEEDMEGCKREPQCRNCNGPHVATSKDCPKRKIPGKKSSQLREPLGSQERASTDWVPDWTKKIANENKPKPQPQLTETKEKETARVDERRPPDFLDKPGTPKFPWERWIPLFEYFLGASGALQLSAERRQYLLRHCLGLEGQRIFDTLPSSRAVAVPSQATTSAAASSPASSSVVATPTRRDIYQEAVDSLSAHFQRSCNLSLERHRFHRRYQRPEESLSDYLTDLRVLAVPANFGPQQDENIREQFTAGVLSTQVRERLLLDSNLPFDQAVQIVLNIERTKAEAKELTIATEQQSTCHVAHDIHKVDYHRQSPRGTSSSRKPSGRNFPPQRNTRHSSLFHQASRRAPDLVLDIVRR